MQLDTSMHEMSSDEASAYVMDQYAYGLRTCMIAECVSFDAAKNCVTVQPLLQTKIDDKVSSLPVISGVPVGFYQAGGFAVTHKPAKGDVCLLLINDRSIAQWKLKGGITDPASPQHHNFNDAIAYFGINDFTSPIQSIKDGIDIRSKDGGSSLNVTGSTATLKLGGTAIFTATTSGVTFNVPVTAPQITANQATINGVAFTTHKHTGVTTGGGTSGGPTA